MEAMILEGVPAPIGLRQLAIVEKFVLPRPSKPLPLTALGKILNVTLGGKIMARLQFHPLTKSGAQDIQTILHKKIRLYYNQTFSPNRDCLTAPHEEGGFAILDIERMNAICAITTLHRGFNSKNKTFRLGYDIMNAAYQCAGPDSHRCHPPFLKQLDLDETTSRTKPAVKSNWKTWEIARQYLFDNEMTIIPNSTRAVGTSSHHAVLQRSSLSDLTEAKLKPWYDIGSALINLVLSYDTTLAAGNGPIVWATDGSTYPATMFQARRTSFAVVGPINYSARMKDNFATIRDAEICAIAIAMILDGMYRKKLLISSDRQSLIYTDQLHIAQLLRASPLEKRMFLSSARSSRHLLGWLLHLAHAHPNLEVRFQKAHTNEQTEGAIMNDMADQAAKSALEKTATFRSPREFADAHILCTSETGVTHQNPKGVVMAVWDKHRSYNMPRTGNVYRYLKPALKLNYKTASGSQTLLWAKSRQLPTQARMEDRRMRMIHNHCMLCEEPAASTDERHIFLKCPGSRSIIHGIGGAGGAIGAAEAIMKKHMRDEDIQDPTWEAQHKHLVNCLFTDGPLWEDTIGCYWEAELPAHFPYRAEDTVFYARLTALTISVLHEVWTLHRKARQRWIKDNRVSGITDRGNRPAVVDRTWSSETIGSSYSSLADGSV